MVNSRNLVRWLGLFVCVLFLISAGACKKKDEDKQETKKVGDIPGGGDNELTGFAAVASNVETVSDNMIPDSLLVATDLALSGDEDPCMRDGERISFMDCQPILLRMYLDMSKEFVDMLVDILSHVDDIINNLDVGSTGTLTEEQLGADDDEAPTKIDYKITSETAYQLLFYFEDNDNPSIYLNVSEGNYELKFDIASIDDEHGGSLSTNIAYTSEEEFEVAVTLDGMECDDNDLGAPETLRIDTTKNSDNWIGKAMMYNPRWMVPDGSDCSVDVTSDTKMFIYTDFIADDDYGTAGVYMLKDSVDDKSDIADHYNITDFCDNWSDQCDGTNWGDTNVADFPNPACLEKDGNHEWDTECDGLSTDDWSSESKWYLPEKLEDVDIEIPETL